jgi:nitrate reductase delta subunit
VSAVVLQAASLLLGYPDEQLRSELPLIRAALPPGHRLHAVVDHLESAPLGELQQHYVDTFDLRRRCCLYLTYYTHGDTRKRGMALLRFRHAYKASGVELRDGELPDHLAVVCEYGATTDSARGIALLTEHRAGLELLRAALADLDSPYVEVIDAVRELLPAASRRDLERAAELARTGPPEEEVGLEPFGPPEPMGGRR